MSTCTNPELMAAIQACLAHAKAVLFRDICDVADAMSTMPSRDAVYKWAQTGRLPLAEIPAFELACDANHISIYLASCRGYILIKAPQASGPAQLDFARTQCQVAKAILAASVALVDAKQAPDAISALSLAAQSLMQVRAQFECGSAK